MLYKDEKREEAFDPSKVDPLALAMLGVEVGDLNNNDNNKHAYAGQLNSFTHPRRLLVLYAGGILTHATCVGGHYSSNCGHSDTGGVTARVP